MKNCFQFWIETVRQMELREEYGIAQNEGFGWILDTKQESGD